MRILIIVAHMSTGGMPQVALKRVESLVNEHEVYFIEYREIAWAFVVQRNRVKKLLGDKFISLGWIDKEEIRDHFQEVVERINPDIIHMEEIPEKFIFGMRKEHIDWLYRPERTYKIIETTHTSTFDISEKKYFPDRFIFMSNYSKQEYSRFNIPSSVIEYPIEKLEKNKSLSIKTLNFDPEYFHILNVGLFTSDKNQGYLFDIAKKMKDYKIHFHFVGNQADNFSDYWKPLLDNKLDNCFIHGERDDADLFYQASDLVVHPSILELNPLAIKEATSYDLPVFLNNITTYLNMYDSYKNVKYLTMNIDRDVQIILNNFNIKRKDDNSTFKNSLINEYQNMMISNLKSAQSNNIIDVDVKSIDTIDYNIIDVDVKSIDTIDYNINFVDGAKVEILGNKKFNFDVEIFDKNTNNLIYKTTIPTNNWCSTNAKYYKEYKIDIKNKDQLLITHDFNLENRNVLIQLDSRSIGDTLAWFPYVEEFRKKHNCKIYCITFWNSWFVNQYSEITFLEPGGGGDIKNLYAHYFIGWYQPIDSNRNPNDYRKIPLQKTASDILGLEYKEVIPKIEIPEGVRPIEEKYVCIAQYSTANTKHWHYPCKNSNKGWQIIVDWLNTQGYKVMVISKQETKLKNVIDRTGNFPIEHRINELKWCEFFIGVGSGLSWLAWAVGKKVVMMSGFSNPICEFKTNIINVHNFNVCNGCFNKYMFDRGDWNWCPDHKDTDRQFECSKNITPQMVTDRMISSKLVENPKYFNFEEYNIPISFDEKDINLIYEKENNKITITYKGETPTPKMNIDIKDFYTGKVYHVVSDISLDKNYVIWCAPNEKFKKTDKLLISFYEKNKILDIEFNI